MSTEWALMTWQQVREAALTNPVVLVPIGCVETQGPYTPIGFEYATADRLARDVALLTGAIALPALPFGNSDAFEAFPGTVRIRPRALMQLYKDVFLSVHRSGFRKILCIAFHSSNQPLIEEAAREVRQEVGILVSWVNPGALAGEYFQEFFDDPAAVSGHGAEPSISLARFLYGTDVPLQANVGETGTLTYHGLDVKRGGLRFRDFPVGMPLMWDELYPKSGGLGDPSRGSADIGHRLYDRIIDYLTGLVGLIASSTEADPPLSATPGPETASDQKP